MSYNSYEDDGYGRRQVSFILPLIALNVVFFLFTQGSDRMGLLLAFQPRLVLRLEVWRLVTYMFVHGSFVHLLFNMWGLYLFGRLLEGELGSWRFLILYFVSGIIGALLWSVFNFNRNAILIGASGAIFGVVVATAMAFPDMRIMLLIPPIPMKLKTFCWVYIIIEVLEALFSTSSVAHLAHLGGALGGFLFINSLKNRNRY